MNRLAEEMVFSGLSTACRLANWPTRRSPVLANPTTDGVKRLPSLLMITVGLPPSITATTEFVVPRSMPTAFAILHLTALMSRLPPQAVSATRDHLSGLYTFALSIVLLIPKCVSRPPGSAIHVLLQQQMPCQLSGALICKVGCATQACLIRDIVLCYGVRRHLQRLCTGYGPL